MISMIKMDSGGNITQSIQNATPSYALSDGSIVANGGQTTYDANGNITASNPYSVTVDWYGNLTAIQSSTNELSANLAHPRAMNSIANGGVSQSIPVTISSSSTGGAHATKSGLRTEDISTPTAQISSINEQMDVGVRGAAIGESVSHNGVALNLPDNPWSLRLVPVTDNGAAGNSQRSITYQLTKLDGKSNPAGTWYVTEHQSDHSVTTSNDGMSEDDTDKNYFSDLIGCFLGCPGTNTNQTFSISPKPGVCGNPSFGNVQDTACTSNGGTIVVHTPQSGDFGVLWIHFATKDVTVNGFYRWPGVD